MPDQRSQKVTELFDRSVQLRRGTEYFGSIQFDSSPLKIAYAEFQAIMVFNNYIATTIYRNQKCGPGPGADVPAEAIASLVAVIAFDHLLTHLFLAVAVAVEPNALAIGEYLKAFGEFEQSSKLEYASTSLQTALTYLRNFKDE
jgi:hypothetical protein